MKQIAFLFLLLLSLAGFGQKASNGIVTIVQAGLLEGEKGSAFGLKAFSGLQSKIVDVGAGAGLDYYYVRSIPVFLDLRKAFGSSNQKPFVYAEGGYHFPWLTTADKQLQLEKAKGGLYYDAGFGYQFPVMKQSLMFFSAGFTYKTYKTFYEYTICPFAGACYTQNDNQVFRLRRLSIQTGLRF